MLVGILKKKIKEEEKKKRSNQIPQQDNKVPKQLSASSSCSILPSAQLCCHCSSTKERGQLCHRRLGSRGRKGVSPVLHTRGIINSTLAWHEGSFSNIWDQTKFQDALFSPTPSSTLILLPLPCLAWEVLLQLQKLFCVLMMELKKLSLDGSSQREKKFGGCYKHITHLGQPPPPIHFNKICLFCYKSWFDFWKVKCPPLPGRNGTFYMSPLFPSLLKSLML